MVAPTIGAVVLVRSSFSDLSNSKLRPAFIVANAGKGDWICVQITSNPYADTTAIDIDSTDFASGSLQRVSFARPGKIFTANETIFARTVGLLKTGNTTEIKNAVVSFIQQAT